jgi:LEM3 (ligand-effect modulator 3) family / CDC50 family
MTTDEIAWGSGQSRYKKTTYTNDQVEPPPNWLLQYPNGYTDERPIPDISTLYPLQVWMRTAGLPTFSKLALRNANDVMKAGTYEIDIGMRNDPTSVQASTDYIRFPRD